MGYDIMGLDDILGADDIMGADDILGADELLGAQVRRRRSQSLARPSLFNKIPGVSAPNAAKLPLGVGFALFATTGTGAITGTSTTLTTRPQVPVIPRRLVVSVSGTNNDKYGAFINNLRVGTKSILASATPLDARAFGPGAFGVELVCDAAQPGIDITVDLGVDTAPAAGDQVKFNVTIICDSVM
jgi:hypothetical protein